MATATTPLVLNDSFVVNSDATYYAVYSDAISTDASRNVDYDNFTFTAISYTDPADSSFNIASGYHVQPKEGISLSGKITIPAYYNNLPIISIGGFGSINQAEVS